MFGFSPLSLVSLFVQGAGTMMSMQSQKQSLQYQQMQYAMQERQYKAEADAYALEIKDKELTRKQKFNQELSENRALMAQSGITLDSPSYRAFLKSNRDVMKRDIQSLRTMGLEGRLNALYNAQQAKLSSSAAKINYQTNVMNTLTNTASNVFDLSKEFSTSRSLFDKNNNLSSNKKSIYPKPVRRDTSDYLAMMKRTARIE